MGREHVLDPGAPFFGGEDPQRGDQLGEALDAREVVVPPAGFREDVADVDPASSATSHLPPVHADSNQML